MRTKILVILFVLFLLPKQSFAYEINPINESLQQTADSLSDSLYGEQIKEFNTDISINSDGSIDVVETIDYFFDSQRHGIYRNIPYTLYDNDKRYDMQFAFSDVVDSIGQKYKASVYKNGEEWVLKIGDPDKTITGDHTYIISYNVQGALRYFENHDELYWNITGNGWEVPIKKTQVNINFPVVLSEEKVKIECFTGSFGETKTNCTGTTDGEKTHFETTIFLNAYEGLTIAYAFPKGIVEELKPTPYVPFFERWYGKLVFVGIIFSSILWYFILPIYLVIKWLRFGRDPFAGIPVTATFDPPKIGKRNLTPAEAGALLDEHVDKKDLFATIVDLAFRKHLKIVEKKSSNFHLVKIENKKDLLLPFEQALYDGVFEDGNDVELKKVKFYKTATKVEDMLYKLIVEHKYFLKNPKSTRSLYYILGGVSFFTFNLVLAFISFLFGRHMPAKTLLGAQTATKARGLKNFLVSQERQLNYQGDKQMLFEKLLPYAVAFGVEKQWAKRFEKFDLKNPDWYEGSSTSHFHAALLASQLSKSYSSFSSSATPPSSSSSSGVGGGGFSGGGGGGGGGGSW